MATTTRGVLGAVQVDASGDAEADAASVWSVVVGLPSWNFDEFFDGALAADHEPLARRRNALTPPFAKAAPLRTRSVKKGSMTGSEVSMLGWGGEGLLMFNR